MTQSSQVNSPELWDTPFGMAVGPDSGQMEANRYPPLMLSAGVTEDYLGRFLWNPEAAVELPPTSKMENRMYLITVIHPIDGERDYWITAESPSKALGYLESQMTAGYANQSKITIREDDPR